MKKCVSIFAIISILPQFLLRVNCGVYERNNVEDKSYWHKYNLEYLRKALSSSKNVEGKIAKNVIIFVGDGMSLTTVAAARIFKGQLNKKSGEESELLFENFPHVGFAKTYNLNSQVPDSAGTATAIFSGIKADIKVISLNPASLHSGEYDRLKTIIDWGQMENKRTGIITNTRITHATPSSAYAYSSHRDYECDTKVPYDMRTKFKDIARQLVENKPGNKLNVIFGGGRDFLGNSTLWQTHTVKFAGSAEISCNRTDKENLVEKYLRQFSDDTLVEYVTNTGELLDVDYNNVDHVMGLFANNHMEYNSLRDASSEGEPSLTEMTKAAIKILANKKNQNGFVLIVEGGKIDQAHHQNHARLALEETIEFENAVKQAKEMTSSDDTLIIVTADHGQSMFFTGYQDRGNDILEFASNSESLVYLAGPGYWYHLANDSENLFKPLANFTSDQRMDPLYMHQSFIPRADSAHSGEDVGVYATGPGSFLIQRVFEQCYIAYAISYTSCIGPAAFLNPLCTSKKSSSVNKIKINCGLIVIGLICFIINMKNLL